MPPAIRIHEHGGPEVLKLEDVSVPPPEPEEATIEHLAVGLNFIDIYHRSGLYKLPLPCGIGLEGSGVVTQVGSKVTEVRVGDRVAYAGGPIGAYSHFRNIPAWRLVKLPEDIDYVTAAGMMLRGLTAAYLLKRTYRVKPGDWVLFHAAAGGLGLIACQWAKALGARVIGTVGSASKGELAIQYGCDYIINYRLEDVAARVKEITKGEGVHVVYDGVGQDTWEASLDCLRPMGMMVSLGNASGPVPSIDLLQLSQKGSLFVTRPTLMHYAANRQDLLALARELFEAVESKKVKIVIGQVYSLKDAAQAHRELAARATTGSSVFLP